MNAKERVLTAIAHQKPDRIPIQTYLTPEIRQKLMDYFGFTDWLELYEKFGVDMRNVEVPYEGQLPPVPPGSDIVDEWGVGYTLFDHGHGYTLCASVFICG